MTDGIRCIIGLGNPGNKYQDTRHNAGFWYADQLAADYRTSLRPEARFFGDLGRINTSSSDCWILKPSVFMNRSGQSASAIANFYKLQPEQILVVHDELDLPPGTVRLKSGGGHGGHNGLRDICSALNSKNFYRLRIGIGHPGHRDQVVDYVLNRPSKAEHALILQSIDLASRYTEQIIAGEFQRVMNDLHS